MSGGGGGGYGPGGGGEPVSCDIVVEGVILQNVDEDTLNGIELGDELEITLEGSSPIAIDEDGFVGSILYPDVARLIRCMREGYDYIAHVTDLDENEERCVVTIRNA
jgi:hypothetical protein